MSKKAASSCNSATPSVATRDPEAGSESDAAIGAAAGAATGIGLWGLAMPVANMIGFTTTGIAGGSTAASMMSAAAVANGGGVASGSVVAIMQSVGAVGLATPVGLGLVAGGAAIGGAAFLVKSRLSGHRPKEGEEAVEGTIGDEDEHKGRWVLIEISPESGKPNMHTFDDDYKARNAFLNSSATSKALFDPEQKLVLEHGWNESMNALMGRGSNQRAAVGAAVGGGAYGVAVVTGLTAAAATTAATMSAAPVAAGAVIGTGLWVSAVPIINAVGFTASGIASGSAAASMMSASAIASGGGVVSGSTVAILQSIGAVGFLATPVGLGIASTAAAIGLGVSYVGMVAAPVATAATSGTAVASMVAGAGAVIGAVGLPAANSIRSFMRQKDQSTEIANNKDPCWILVKLLEADPERFGIETFDNEDDGRVACRESPVSSALFDLDGELVLTYGYQASMAEAFAKYRNH